MRLRHPAMSKKEMEASHAPDGCLLPIQVSSSQPGMQRQTERWYCLQHEEQLRHWLSILGPFPHTQAAAWQGSELWAIPLPKAWPNAWYNMDPYEMRATRPLRLNRSSYLVGGMSSWDISEYTAQHFQWLYRLFLCLKRRKKKNQKFPQ